MTDRDTFAAAALTGLLAGLGGKTAEQWALHAYSLADAMLRERERTNHDAVPEAKATNDGGTPKDADGTGNTGESLSESLPDYCWDGDTDGGDEMRIDDECRDPDLLAAEVRRLRTVIAAGETTLTAEEREAIEDAAGICEEHAEEYDGTTSSLIADILRNLLARLA